MAAAASCDLLVRSPVSVRVPSRHSPLSKNPVNVSFTSRVISFPTLIAYSGTKNRPHGPFANGVYAKSGESGSEGSYADSYNVPSKKELIQEIIMLQQETIKKFAKLKEREKAERWNADAALIIGAIIGWYGAGISWKPIKFQFTAQVNNNEVVKEEII